MEQHPVPQNITSYQFRLIGDMTLRQFFLLAGGCAVALIFYALPIIGILKWPLVIFSGFMGFALAFVPIEERPLDKWIVAFVKAVFSPTQFVWKKTPPKAEIFSYQRPAAQLQEKQAPPSDQGQVAEFLETLPKEEDFLEKQEEDFIKKIMALFQAGKKPDGLDDIGFESKYKPKKQEKEKEEKKTIEKELPLKKKRGRPRKDTQVETEAPSGPETKTQRGMEEILRSLGEKQNQSVEAKTSQSLPFPDPINVPNTLVGMVLDKDEKIVEKAIIEIREADGLPVRALITNALGQFRSVNPLKNGPYEIVVEKEPLKFDIFKINLKGEIVEPIKIKAK
ncbi:PrgI family protein [Patescibacteria group bacterium]|nr:PrgI family protein [Patescibacteria group bacterium]